MSDETKIGGDLVQGDKVGGDKVEGDKHVYHYGDGRSSYSPPPLPPRGRLPERGNLPPGSHPLHSHYPNFVGREAELLGLANALLYDEAVPNSAAVNTAVIAQPAIASGMGGIGKTQLAVEFMYRYGRFFAGGVYWISFSDPEAIGAEIAACSGALTPAEQATFHTLDLLSQERLVWQAWQQPTPRLLIFDNLDDENSIRLLDKYRPKTGGCRLLVTSRRNDWPQGLGATVHAVGTLPRAESITLLQQLVGNDPATEHSAAEAELDAIADALGDLPLALHLAGSYLHHYRNSVAPAAYLERVSDPNLLSHPSLTGKKAAFSPTGHELNVARTFAISYERLDATDPEDGLGLALLARLAHFSPSLPTPLPLLTASLRSDPFTAADLADTDMEDALQRLGELGLIEQEAGEPSAHRLIAAFVRNQQPTDGAQQDVEEMIFREANKLNHAGYPRELLPWQAHLRHITDAAVANGSEKGAGLCNELGYHLRAVGDLEGARPYYEGALEIRQKVLGEAHPDTALSLNNIGYLLDSMGDLEGARPYYEGALEIRQKVLGEAHPDTAQSLNNMGALLDSMGDLEGARPYFEDALEIRQKVLGEAHPDTALSLNNMGYLLDLMGDLEGARPYYESALEINKKVLGEAHPDTALSLNNMGYLLQAMGDLEGARPYYEGALEIRQKVLGEAHPDTAASLNNMGGLLDSMGDLEGARPYYEGALEINKKVLGEAHPDTALSLNNMGYLLKAMGDLEGARPYYEGALEIRQKVLGEAHPDTATSLNNMGGLLQAMGDLEGARPYYEGALEIRQKVLGEAHHDTGTSIWWMGVLAENDGNLAEARDFYQRTYDIFTNALGSEHPRTQSVHGFLQRIEDALR